VVSSVDKDLWGTY